jgi:hypothetical protein
MLTQRDARGRRMLRWPQLNEIRGRPSDQWHTLPFGKATCVAVPHSSNAQHILCNRKLILWSGQSRHKWQGYQSGTNITPNKPALWCRCNNYIEKLDTHTEMSCNEAARRPRQGWENNIKIEPMREACGCSLELRCRQFPKMKNTHWSRYNQW